MRVKADYAKEFKYNTSGICSHVLFLFLVLELIQGAFPEGNQPSLNRIHSKISRGRSENTFEPDSTDQASTPTRSRRSLLDGREPGPYALGYDTRLEDGYYYDYYYAYEYYYDDELGDAGEISSNVDGYYYEYEYYYDDQWDNDDGISSIGYTSAPTADLDNPSNDFLLDEKRYALKKNNCNGVHSNLTPAHNTSYSDYRRKMTIKNPLSAFTPLILQPCPLPLQKA